MANRIRKLVTGIGGMVLLIATSALMSAPPTGPAGKIAAQRESSDEKALTPAAKTAIVLVYNFNKQWRVPNTCLIDPPEKVKGGDMLKCSISLPTNLPKGYFISDVQFSCQPSGSGPCNHTVECPGGGICITHVNKTEPANLPVAKVRDVTWYGWTDDGNNATLSFKVFATN
ncbi:MAG: hypothetical protein HY255_11225 [Betaproteobacteria bacterium]|nr:hypothetical protein [Betaproteobacteria bacterium]